MRRHTGGLWRQADFLKLWAGESISLLGSQVTLLALPLTAALLLGASPTEMGLLGSLGTIPYLLFGLPAGVWADRLPRRPLMQAANLGRAALLASIPVAAVGGTLRLEHLYVVAFGAGLLGLLFGVAYAAYLPSVVPREDLPEGNARLALSEAVARVAGPGLGGSLVQILSAPMAIAVDAASFAVSAAFLHGIRAAEPPREGATARRSMLAEISEGLRAVVADRYLRPLHGASALGSLGDGLLGSSGVGILFMTRELGLEPAGVGAAFASVGIGGLAGAAMAAPLTRRLGIGATFLGAMLAWGGGTLLIALAGGPPAVAVPLLTAGWAVIGLVNPIGGVNAASVRQAVTPDRLLGRVAATGRVLTWGTLPVGALAGGLLAERIGLRATIALAGLFPLLGFVWLLRSPVRTLRGLPAPAMMPADPAEQDATAPA